MDRKHIITNTASAKWRKDPRAPGVDIKCLGSAGEYSFALYRFAPHTTYPDHMHTGPEFVYLLEGRARQYGEWLEAGWASVGSAGTLDNGFLSSDSGCVFLCVYTASRYEGDPEDGGA